MTTSDPPASWVELLTIGDWERVRELGGFIVIADSANDSAEGGPKSHHRRCRSVTLANFREKVLDPLAAGQRPNGRYFWVTSQRVALAGGARVRAIGRPPLRVSLSAGGRASRTPPGRLDARRAALPFTVVLDQQPRS